MMINYNDMTIGELEKLYNELERVISERKETERAKAIDRVHELIAELNDLMEEYRIILEVEDFDDNCSVRTDLILGTTNKYC